MNKIETYNSEAIESILRNFDPKLEKQVEFRMKLAAKIDNARKKLGWSKKLLAEKLSKRPSEVSKWLSGTHNFTSDTLFEIQYLMGVELIGRFN
jgi:ribosome-binding protein aMBF1 (putative translation factor)